MALKIKKVHPSVVGQSGSRLAYAIYDGSSLVHKTTRGGGRGGPLYGLTETKAKFLLAKEQAKRARGEKAPKATPASASTSRPARQKLGRQELTITGCTNFLRAEGYSVSKKKGSSRKKAKTLDEMLEDGDISFMEAVAMGYEENPRKRTRKKQRKAADTLFRGKKGASKFHLKRQLAALKRAQESLRLEYNNDLISFDDYRTITDDLSAQMEMIEQELGMYDNPRKNPLPQGPYKYDPDGAYMEGYFSQEGGPDSGVYDFYTVRGRKTKATDGITVEVRPVQSWETPFHKGKRWRVEITHSLYEDLVPRLIGGSQPNTHVEYMMKEPTPHDIQQIIDRVVSSRTLNVPGYGRIIQIRARPDAKRKRAVKGRSSWQQYLRLMKGKGYSMNELRVGYRQLEKKYPNNTEQLLAAARKLPVKRKNPRASGIRMRENFEQLVKYAGDVGEPSRFEFFSAQPMSSRGKFGSKPFIIEADDAFDIEDQVNLYTMGRRVLDVEDTPSEVIIQGLSAKQAEDMVNSKKAEFFEPGSRRLYSSWPFKSARKRKNPRAMRRLR